jgi:hypothetical protein
VFFGLSVPGVLGINDLKQMLLTLGYLIARLQLAEGYSSKDIDIRREETADRVLIACQ